MREKKILAIKRLGFPWETQDPFLFCAYHRDEYPEGDEEFGLSPEKMNGRNIGQDFVVKDGFRMYHGSHVPGFPYHPHRGFETITINKEGLVDHSDSLGGAGRFGAGDVQWMTAGKGILHSEMFPLLRQDEKNPLEIFQVWLNLPRAKKFVEPHFKMLWKEMIPTLQEVDEDGKKTEVDVIAGSLKNTIAPQPTPDSWAASSENGISILTIKMEANATWMLPLANKEGVHRTIYFYKGESVNIGGEKVAVSHIIKANPTQNILLENGSKESCFLVLEGKPINEPVVQHGPFVMNTRAEIQEAFFDYQRTQFGGWPWPQQEQIHGRSKGRFALHANGEEEVK